MHRRIAATLICFAFAVGGAGCAKKKDTEGGKAEKKLTLTVVKDAAYGYEIQIIKGSKSLQKDNFGHVYSYPLPGGMHEYHVTINTIAGKSLAEQVKLATVIGNKQIAEKKAIEGGFLVVKAPQGELQEVWVSKKGPTTYLGAKCSGPKKGIDLLTKMCTSLKVTK